MDIDLLSRMVKELILDNDEVSLPGVGCFVAEMVPSTFSDKGYTINPPYRRLFFRPRPSEGDTALVSLYSKSNGCSLEDADRIVSDFLSEMKEVLRQKKIIVFPGLGRLRATRENNFFFVPDEDLDIYPSGMGLEPISLKTHQETTEEVSQALDGFKAIMEDGPVPEISPESVTETAPESAPESIKEEYSSPDSLLQHTPEVEAPAAQEDELPYESPEEQTPAVQVEEPLYEAPEVEAPEAMAPAEEVRPAIEEAPAPKEIAVPKEKKKMSKGLKVTLWTLLALAVVLTLAFSLFMCAVYFAPDWLDTLLYSKEELYIINGILP